MTTIYSTNFDSDSAGSLPAGWANKVGTWAVRASGAVSVPNCLSSTSNADGDVVLYGGAAAIADMSMTYSMKQAGTGTPPPLMGVVLRSDIANSNNYTVVFGGSTAGSVAALLFKKVGGAFSQVTTANITLAQTAGDTIFVRATIIGNTIRLYVGNGSLPSTPSATFTDSSITAAGYPGLYNGKNNQSVSMGIDDFVLDDTTVVVDTTPPVLSNPTATQTGQTTASGTVSTNEGNGTLYRSASTNATETVAAIKAASQSSTVTATGTQNVGFTGLTAGTTYYAHYVQTDAAGNDSAVANSASFTTASSSNNALTSNTAGVLFSPYNWDIAASSAKTINAGAYFRTIFSGTTCTLNFDMTGVASPVPQISYRVDRFGPWINVPIAASVAITIPSDTADYANKPGHFLEVVVKSMTETQARWSTQATMVKLTGILLDAGKTILAPPALPLKAVFYGDSITEGVRTVNMTATNDTDRNDAGQGWSLEVARMLGAEIGNVGFGGSGFNVTGSGGVPPLASTYNFLYSGVARSFAVSPDFIVMMEGTNDSADVTTNATTVLNGLIAATTAKIIVLRPFKDASHATQLQAAILACSAPSRCTYVDTANFFTVGNSSDNLHPYGVENITHIAPLVASAIRPVLSAVATPPVTTARNFSVVLGDTTGAAANLTGLAVHFYETPNLGTNNSTNASGTLSATAQTTLTSGANGYASVVDPATGRHWAGQVQVS